MRTLSSLALLAALVLSSSALSLPALAQAPGDDDGGGGGPGMLFISPSGEPFRGKPGEPYPVAAWFAQADANHDGRLDRSEFVADAMRFFARLDVNQNGRIDSEELSYYEHAIAPEILVGQRMGALEGGRIVRAAYLDQMGGMGGGMGGMGGGGMGGGMGGGGGGGGRGGHGGGSDDASPPAGGPARAAGHGMDGAAPYGLLGEPEPVAASDFSFSGSISAADFRRRAGQRFDRLDTDKKGYLELASLPKTVAQTLAERGGPGGHGKRHGRPPGDGADQP